MIETSFQAWAGFIVLLLAANTVGILISRNLPWSVAARQAGMSWSVGIGIAPFIVGLLSVAALAFLPAASHGTHFIFVLVFLGILAGGLTYFLQNKPYSVSEDRLPWNGVEKILLFFVGLWGVALLLNTLFIPLTQNDSLEYATVGRILFESRDLASYPAIDPEGSSSGFFGPWTHPPLYVSLMYLMNVIQGHADEPGLIRMIAPWFALAGTIVVYTFGQLVSRFTGLMAALIFLSTPLFFLGADSALIDPLPILGSALLIAVLIGVEASPARRGAVIGGILGLGLWTHSQAILFFPLALAGVALHYGLLNWKKAVREGFVLVAASLLVGGIPYVNNYLLFGSPISDNPAVFALESLGFKDYFSVARGLDNPVALIQYGIFKGWFALEAFGWTFWFMLMGLVIFTYRLGFCTIKKGFISGISVLDPLQKSLWIMAGILLVYYGGIVASIALGIDLMVKNERYLLVILPLACVFGGYALTRVMSIKIQSSGPCYRSWLLICLLLASVLQVVVLMKFRWGANNISLASMGQDFEEKLSNWPAYQAVQYLREQTPRDALVFSLKPADMYYSKRKMVSYLDERLLPFYKESDTTKAAALLQSVGITHIHSSDYSLPPLYNSSLIEILADPSLSVLEFSAEGSQIYRLKSSQMRAVISSVDLLRNKEWTKQTSLIIGGRKAISNIDVKEVILNKEKISKGGLPFGLFHRDISTTIVMNPISIKGNSEYLVDLAIKSKGFSQISVGEYGCSGELKRKVLLGHLTAASLQQHNFKKRIFIGDGLCEISISIVLVGTSSILLEKAFLIQLFSKN